MATSGCHATTFHLILDTVSVSFIIGSFFLRSHITHFVEKVEANICCTCLFHETHRISSNGCVFVPGSKCDHFKEVVNSCDHFIINKNLYLRIMNIYFEIQYTGIMKILNLLKGFFK